MNAQVLALVNQKGGTGKSTSYVNLGVGLAMAGKILLYEVLQLEKQRTKN